MDYKRIDDLAFALKQRGFTGYLFGERNDKLYIEATVKVPFLLFFTKKVKRTIGFFDFVRQCCTVEPEYKDDFEAWFPEFQRTFSVDEVARAMCGKMGIEYDR